MGKSKIGKQRKDKFYKLAKETGYRSRASFKLIQLNRKFEFLQRSRVVIDLCAAPGGWLQVARQTMPVSSLIIGVDLVPIRSIPNVITMEQDITTDKCRQALKKEMKTWKADTVLHDGSPNVGKSWMHDAFAQVQLTLSALKLATEFLVRGGWFITKVFRSKDYDALLWVLRKLFKRVHVTKPQASRNESAEIFVICQSFLAPDSLDPKFLDPCYVFEDVEAKNETKANIERISKPNRKPVGYEGEISVYNKLNASDFLTCNNHLEKLAESTEIIFDDKDIAEHKLTTDKIKEYCKDIKVLGKAELRSLLNWRKKLTTTLKELEDKNASETKEPTEVIEIEEKEIADALSEAENLRLSKAQELKRKKKKILKERRKIHEKMNLKMIIKNDEPIIEEDIDLFRMTQLKNKKDLDKVGDDIEAEFNIEPDEVAQNDEAGRHQNRKQYVAYDRYDDHDAWGDEDRRPAKKNKTQEHDVPTVFDDDDSDTEEELEFESDHDDEEGTDEKPLDSDGDDGEHNPLVIDLADRKDIIKDKVSKWFDKEDFEDIAEDNDLEMEILAEKFEKKQQKSKNVIEFPDNDVMEVPDKSKNNEVELPVNKFEKKGKSKKSEKVKNAEGKAKDENDAMAPITENKENAEEKDKSKKGQKRKKVILDPEGLALGTLMIQSKKMRRDIIDNSYNRYASNDDGLPDWFIRDEEKHYRKQIPVTAEMVQEYKEQLKAINARPVKKVVEAKARKKKKVLRRLERARKKAEAVTESLDMSEREKNQQIKDIYKKATTRPAKETTVTYVVAKKGVRKRAGRPPGVKGRYKVVDKRMKKDDMQKKKENKLQMKGKYKQPKTKPGKPKPRKKFGKKQKKRK